MARENRTKYAVLGLLGWMPMSGYDIKKVDEVSAGYFWNSSYGQIYPILKQLQEEGLAEAVASPADGHPGRQAYAITDLGRERLREWLEAPSDRPKLRLEALLKVFHGFQAPPAVTIDGIERFRAQIVASDEEREANVALARPRWTGRFEKAAVYWELTVRFGELVNEAMIRWCDEALAVLREESR